MSASTDEDLQPSDQEHPALAVEGRGRSADRRVVSRLVKDQPLDLPQVVPSSAADPIAAQRDFRGWIVLVIIVLVLIGVALSYALVAKVSNRQVIYAPQAQRIGAANLREPTEDEIKVTLQIITARMATWSPGSVKTVFQNVLPYLHPTLHATTKETYEKLAQQAEYLWSHRAAIPIGVASAGRDVSGVRTYAVFFDLVEMTGKDEKDRKFIGVSQKAVYVKVVLDTPTDGNPLGIVVVHFKVYTEEEWIQAGFPAMWAQLRTPTKEPAQ